MADVQDVPAAGDDEYPAEYPDAYEIPQKAIDYLSEFQKLKFLHVFGTFYDRNGDGAIDWVDFEMDLKKLSNLLKWNDEQKKTATTALDVIWKGLRNFADVDKDERISQDEWLLMWADCCKQGEKESTLPKWLDGYIQFMFQANDINNDGLLDLDEYTTFFTEYGLRESDCVKAFNAVTENGKHKLDYEKYKEIWHRYFLSRDPKEPCNSLFGVTYTK